jgi:hypothetical protein
MQVKWEKRSLKTGLNRKSINLRAVLVESCPNNEYTKQRIVDNLGDIDEKFLSTNVQNMRAFHQGLFWVAVDKKLDHLKLDARLRNKIEAVILKTVSRPDKDWALWGVTCIPLFDP